MIRISESIMTVETKTQSAILSEGRFVSLISKLDGERYLHDPDYHSRLHPLQLVYPMKRTSPLGKTEEVRVEYTQYSDTLVVISYSGWFGHGEMTVEEDPVNGDICVTPSVHTTRPGLKACRFSMFGLREDLYATIPFMQGVRAPLDADILRTPKFQHLPYPSNWEDNFAAFGNETGGFWFRCEGARCRHKYLHIGAEDTPYAFSVDAENFGPFDDLLSAGGLTWRINVYSGDWTVPVLEYRKVLQKDPAWTRAAATKPDWFDDLRLAVSWCPNDTSFLDGIKKYIDPKRVVVHVPHWRKCKYDQCYPDFTPSDNGRKFIEYGRELGFHMAPHCNSLEIDPSIPEFDLVRDFRYRDADTRDAFGWGVGPNGFLGVPEDGMALRENRRYDVMTKIHPALPAWQNLLCKNVKAAIDMLHVDAMFLDVSLCMWNITQGIVNGKTVMEGMEEIFTRLYKIGGITLGGEGMDEMLLFQHFAQGHSAYLGKNEYEMIDPSYYVPVNYLLFGDLCHIIGYGGGGRNEERYAKQVQCDRNRGFLPTLIGGSCDELERPGSVASQIIERALSMK